MLERRDYDAFGKVINLPTGGLFSELLLTPRGFTDHEHLLDVQLIHMNGRAFDYNAGRFLSVDPFIQSPTNSQSMNPYSYIMNNPLSSTDPTGYCAGTDDLASCADGLKAGETSEITGEGGGTIGKDKDGNVYLTSGDKNDVKGTMAVVKDPSKFKFTGVGKPGVSGTSGKQLTSTSGGKVISATSGLEKSANKSLEELRKKPEFAELEKKYGALTLTFDNKKKTELDGNTININKSIFSIEYEVDANASMDAYGATLPDSMSDDAYYGAIERYQQSLPEYNAFSMNRVIAHEAYHLMQKHVSGMEYTMNREHYEAINIRRTNQFMHKYYNEPFRDENHGKARSR